MSVSRQMGLLIEEIDGAHGVWQDNIHTGLLWIWKGKQWFYGYNPSLSTVVREARVLTQPKDATAAHKMLLDMIKT